MSMISTKFCTIDNVNRAKYAKIGMAVLALIICGYLVGSSVLSLREIWSAQKALSHEKKISNDLTQEAVKKRKQDTEQKPPSNGGVEVFAVTFAQWAASRDITVESLIPEGNPIPTDVSFGTEKLGKWNMSKVRIRGNGQYEQFMSLLDQFKTPDMPVQLESFMLENTDGKSGRIGFDLVLTVYERVSGAS